MCYRILEEREHLTLASTSTLLLTACTLPLRRWHVVQLAADLAVALALILFHATVLICQFMTFSVAMNSKRSNAIIALLIASNFVEIKGVWLAAFRGCRTHSHQLSGCLRIASPSCVMCLRDQACLLPCPRDVATLYRLWAISSYVGL